MYRKREMVRYAQVEEDGKVCTGGKDGKVCTGGEDGECARRSVSACTTQE